MVWINTFEFDIAVDSSVAEKDGSGDFTHHEETGEFVPVGEIPAGALVLQLLPACVGDLDHSGDVDFVDLLKVLSAWGPCSGSACAEDLDASGDVGFIDLLILLSAWGPCP